MKRRGFTLLEILIVIALLGSLLLLLFGTHLQIRQLLAEQSKASQKTGDILAFLKTLSSDLHNLVYEKWNSRQHFIARKVIMGGRRLDELLFTTSRLYNNPASLQTQVHNVHYFADIADGESAVVYRREDVFADPKNLRQGYAIPMAWDIEELVFEFSQSGQSWEDEWDFAVKQVMPRFIRCTLKWKEGGQERMFQFVVRPPILWY
ncbi:MAG: prepilin-type N-terminal cleavage/methylation domain-containing protein [Leptospiraceae bacterium]|nr:prepilin-type N-terminal cleavage/methylation domain-containing protein [Leptospiraceae bacterium]MDW8306759.1 prepilin-type N-terminal cleavage/methylation domain-containing protein [Leptospiraceae bacterium]